MSAIARFRHAAGRARHLMVVTATVAAVIATPAYGGLPAEGETGPPSGTDAATCPSQNPANTLTLAAGTPQSATLGSAFATNLQVTFTNSNGCPVTSAVAGMPVTFSAPSAGASGLFSASGSSTVTVGSDASGVASAPTFIANDTAGAYTVTASSAYGSISFSLTNDERNESNACGAVAGSSTGVTPASLLGKPAKLAAGVGASQSTPTGTRFALRFAVTVTDAKKNPLPGVLVTFAAPVRGPSGRFAIRSNSPQGVRSRTSHVRQVEVETDACGIALAPAFGANHRQGGYIVVASVEQVRTAFALVNEGSRR